MGVGADDSLAGGGQPLFGHQGVFDAHVSHIIEMRDLILFGKLPHCGAQLRRLNVLAGGIVVQDQCDPVLIENPGQARLIELGNGHRCGNIVAQHQIQLTLHQLAGFHRFEAGMARQNLLGHGHSHRNPSFFIYRITYLLAL